jgi:hypothetical protein
MICDCGHDPKHHFESVRSGCGFILKDKSICQCSGFRKRLLKGCPLCGKVPKVEEFNLATSEGEIPQPYFKISCFFGIHTVETCSFDVIDDAVKAWNRRFYYSE